MKNSVDFENIWDWGGFGDDDKEADSDADMFKPSKYKEMLSLDETIQLFISSNGSFTKLPHFEHFYTFLHFWDLGLYFCWFHHLVCDGESLHWYYP